MLFHIYFFTGTVPGAFTVFPATSSFFPSMTFLCAAALVPTSTRVATSPFAFAYPATSAFAFAFSSLSAFLASFTFTLAIIAFSSSSLSYSAIL
jgi:hypothetical protein